MLKVSTCFLIALFFIFCSEPMKDPRLPLKSYSKQELELIYKTDESLNDPDRACVDEYINEYQKKVFEHCEQSGYAKNIAGGCHHVADGWEVANIEAAFKHCKINRTYRKTK